MRIFLDANVLFSAAKADGPVRALLAMLHGREHECWVDAYVMEEARRNLERKAPESRLMLEKLSRRWRMAATLPPATAFPRQVDLPEKDLPVLAAAIHHRCHVLVTGDRSHFGRPYGRTVHGVTIHSPRSLAEALLD